MRARPTLIIHTCCIFNAAYTKLLFKYSDFWLFSYMRYDFRKIFIKKSRWKTHVNKTNGSKPIKPTAPNQKNKIV